MPVRQSFRLVSLALRIASRFLRSDSSRSSTSSTLVLVELPGRAVLVFEPCLWDNSEVDVPEGFRDRLGRICVREFAYEDGEAGSRGLRSLSLIGPTMGPMKVSSFGSL